METITIKQMKNHIDNVVDQLHRIGPGKEQKVSLATTDGRWCKMQFIPKGGDERIATGDVVEFEFILLRGWGDYTSCVIEWDEDLKVVEERLRITAYEGIASNFAGRLMELLVPETEIVVTDRHVEISIIDNNKVIFNTSVTYPHKTTAWVQKFCHDNLQQAVAYKIAYTELLDDVVINP